MAAAAIPAVASIAGALIGKKGSGSGSSTVTQQQQYPDWVNAAAQNNLAFANQIAGRPYEAYPGQRVSGFTPDQTLGQDLIRQNLGAGQDQYQQAYSQAQALGQYGYNPQQVVAPTLPGMNFGSNNVAPAAVNRGDIRDVTGGTFLSGNLSRYMDPYRQNVINTTMSELGRQNQILQGQNDAAASQARAFGGSRHGVLGAETNRNFLDVAGRTAAQLNSDAYNNATNLMGQDLSRGFQAGIANQGADQSVALTNAQLAQQAGLANQSAGLQGQGLAANYNVQGANLAQQAAMANQGAGLSAAQLGSNNMLNSANLMGSLTGQARGAAQGDIAALLGSGMDQQALGQQSLDTAYQDFLRQFNYPVEQLQIAQSGLSSTPYGSSQTVNTPYYGSSGMGALGGGLMGLQLGNALGGLLGSQVNPALAQQQVSGTLNPSWMAGALGGNYNFGG